MAESTTLPTHKRTKLATDTAALVQAYGAVGKSFEEAVAHNIAAHAALRNALDPSGPFMHSFAHQIELETAKIIPSPDYAIPHEESMRSARNILTNRVREEEQFITLLSDPAFLQEVKGTTPATGSTAMPAGKVEEIAARLVQENDPNGPEGATHVLAGAIGHRLLHEALAASYAPNGPLAAPLIEGLRAGLPNASPEELLTIANSWLHDRYHPAKAVADAMKYDGAAYKLAANRADELQAGAKPAPQGFVNRMQARAAAAQDIAIDGL